MDANATIPPVRLVRCPSCSNVLREIPEIPVYKCGGCGMILKAKHHVNTIVGGTSSSGSPSNNIQNASNPSSLNIITTEQNKEKDMDSHERVEENKIEEKIHPADEKTEKLEHPSPVGYDSSKSSEMAEKTVENDTKSAPESPFSYYGSSSSPEMRRERNASNKHLVMSRRTFRHKKIPHSENDNKETEPKVEIQKLPEAENELPAYIHSIERDNTFRSEDFHSVQNWNASDSTEVASKPQSKSFRFHNEEPDHMKILRKVDELRDDLTDYLAKTVEDKKASHLIHRLSHDRADENVIKMQNFKPKTAASVIKSYCRPVYNGAPFVVCYKCRKLLQLPADFLVTRKRLHKLKCGSCSQILLFSFRPKDVHETIHPPSEVENFKQKDDSMSSSSISMSEQKLNVSRSSSYSVRQSRLHRLMGYTSATELLFVPGTDDGYESTEPRTPRFFRPQNSGEIEEEEEEEEMNERLRSRRRGSSLKGLLKKGVQKLKIHSNV